MIRHPFDQYRQTENRLTHALATALTREPGLARAFAIDFLGRSPRDPAPLVAEQAMPGEPAPSEEEAERRGIPDLWLYDPEGRWCAVIESKITASLTAEQLTRHGQMAKRFDFDTVTTVVITAIPIRIGLPASIVRLRWDALYVWLRNIGGVWPTLAAEYFEVLEGKMIDEGKLLDGALTKFVGISFRGAEDYSYLEAKRQLRLALEALRNDERLSAIGIDPTLPGRGAVTGSNEPFVWDMLRHRGSAADSDHTRSVHFTLGIESDAVTAMATLPNGLRTSIRNRLRSLGPDGFIPIVRELVRSYHPLLTAVPGASPRLRASQRRYPSQKAQPFQDAFVDFDIRTLDGTTPVKMQPQWTRAAYEAFNAKQSNLQLQFGVRFPYRTCPELRDESAIRHIADAWLGLRPLIDMLYPQEA